ncbi:MAG: RsbRD N-terminal domain-containing protein [Thermoanaerobacteraceae bacterium]|nr:RsbRD N-terminal domain-containing protein [Thermoanaerobacteraceae bacterium]
MNLHSILTGKRDAILNKWYERVLQTYPAETARLKEEKDRFANPVGHAIYEGLEGLYGELLRGLQAERVYPWLDKILRIRAVQDFAPSQAVAFAFLLKQVVREEMAAELGEGELPWRELLEFESRVDELAALAFDGYMKCREELFAIRVKEIKTRTSRLLQRANLGVNLFE